MHTCLWSAELHMIAVRALYGYRVYITGLVVGCRRGARVAWHGTNLVGYGAPTGAARDLVRFSEIQATALHSHTPLESKPKEHASAGFAIYNHHARHVLCRVESSEYAQTFTTYSTTCTCTTPQYTKAESIHPRN